MLEDIIGHENFLNGIREYLETYKWSNTNTNQLWEIMAKHSFPEIQEIMNCWTKQAGFPLIMVEKIDEDVYKINQLPFRNSDTASVWQIPIKYTTDDFKIHYTLLSEKESILILNSPSK